MRGRPGKKGGGNHDGGRNTGLSAAHIPERKRLREKSAAVASPEEQVYYADRAAGMIMRMQVLSREGSRFLRVSVFQKRQE